MEDTRVVSLALVFLDRAPPLTSGSQGQPVAANRFVGTETKSRIFIATVTLEFVAVSCPLS